MSICHDPLIASSVEHVMSFPRSVTICQSVKHAHVISLTFCLPHVWNVHMLAGGLLQESVPWKEPRRKGKKRGRKLIAEQTSDSEASSEGEVGASHMEQESVICFHLQLKL